MKDIYLNLPKKLFPYILCYRWRLVGILITGLALAAIGGAQIALIRSLFDEGLAGDTGGGKTYAIAAAMLALGLANFPAAFFTFIGFATLWIGPRARCARKFFKS